MRYRQPVTIGGQQDFNYATFYHFGFRDIILITNISHNNFQKSNVEMTSRKENATDGKVVENVGKVGQKPDVKRLAKNVKYFCDPFR